MKRIIPPGILMAVLLSFMGTARGALLIDVDFEDMNLGTVRRVAPTEGNLPVTSPNTQNSAPDGGATATVVQDYEATNPPNTPFGDGKSLVLKKTAAGNIYIPFTLHPGDAVSAGRVVIGFDFMVDNGVTPNGNVFIQTVNSDYKVVSDMLLKVNGELTLAGRVATTGSGTTTSGTPIVLPSLVSGNSYHIEQTFDFDTGLAWVSINDGGPSATQSFAVSSYGIIGFIISTGYSSTTAGEWAVDNVTMEAIPEGGTFSLFVFGFAAIGASRILKSGRKGSAKK
ncbi:MAG TPA: hypothetical protein VNQ90_01465 [Chthoniobacteraceae bacterium]|nr:hypothetical protein [Chthoniobacteraceae bacterium]